MVKILKMENLDCAHCTSQMEKKIKKIQGVNSVSISFMAQKMILDCKDEEAEGILEKVRAAVRSVDEDCTVK